MKDKTRNLTAKSAKSAENNTSALIRHVFTPDTVSIEGPGDSTTFTRLQVESWLAGMDAAKRASSDAAVREEVRRTIEGNNRRAAIGRTALFLLIVSLLTSAATQIWASEIIRGYSPADGQLLYAADLDNLVDESTIGVQFYNDQQTTPVLGSGYYFLVLNPATQTYYRINAQQVLYGNTNIFLNVPPQGVPSYGTILFYDPTNNWIGSTTVSNLLWNSASNIDVAGLAFANTNNANAAYAYVLPDWSGSWSGSQTNNQPALLTWGTNGVPYQMPLSNAEASMAADLGTNVSLPYEYAQEFYPWRVYGTNTASPYTNAFGWPTNFPITAFYQTNVSGTNLPALTDGDTIPVNSAQQGTNTSATLLSIYEYMTNKNALPPYTIARAQFSGIYSEWPVTNMNASGVITNCPLAVNWTNPAPVSFDWIQNTPYTPTVASNTLYWAQSTNWPVPAFQIFTNLACALARTNPIVGTSGYISGYANLLWLTNYTAVNCAVIQACDTTTIEPSVYDCFFSTPSQTAYYYLTGSGQPVGLYNQPISIFLSDFPNCRVPGWASNYSTNGFEFQAMDNNSQAGPSLVQILVQPQ